jgi:CutA1 divalent ion tolerance protein
VLSIGALSAIAFRMGALHSTGMDTSSTTVPFIVVYVTVPNREAGKKLSESIVKEKLAAYGNIVQGIQTVYWWEGKDSCQYFPIFMSGFRTWLIRTLPINN